MKSFSKVIGPVVAFLMTVYFAYHIFQGERGVISWLRLSKKVQADEDVLNQLVQEKEVLERRVSLLRPESLDKDILEEQAKRLLNYKDKNEVVLDNPKSGRTEIKKGGSVS